MDIELIKLIASHAPSVMIAIGIAKIYLRINEFIKTIENQVQQNSRNINKLMKIHIKRHDEDAKEFLDGGDK
jgi:ferritin